MDEVSEKKYKEQMLAAITELKDEMEEIDGLGNHLQDVIDDLRERAANCVLTNVITPNEIDRVSLAIEDVQEHAMSGWNVRKAKMDSLTGALELFEQIINEGKQ